MQRPATSALTLTNARCPNVPQPERVANVEELRAEYARRSHRAPPAFGVACERLVDAHVELRPCAGIELLIGPQRPTLKQNTWLRYRHAAGK